VDDIESTSRVADVAPPPPAGPFVYNDSTSDPIRLASAIVGLRAATRSRTS
jgi:hypothetical protein